MDKRIIRVFPRRTNATPDDELVRVRETPSLFDEADEVHISVAFTWDIPYAEWLAAQWAPVAPVKMGGPAFNEPGGDFVPGMYMKRGYVITSCGCPNRCWFCAVPKREGGQLRELPVTDGWIVTDDNLLACSPGHIDEVFAMLARQPHRPQFVGGLEAALMTPGMAARLRGLKPESMFFAYDTPNDLEPLQAGRTTYSDATCLSAIRATRKKRPLHGWVKPGGRDSYRLRCYTGTRRATSTKAGAAFNVNGPTLKLCPVTAKNTLKNNRLCKKSCSMTATGLPTRFWMVARP